MKDNKLLIAVSGGRSSAMMAFHIMNSKEYENYEKVFVFCNTGQERPETIKFLKDMVDHWGLPLNIVEGLYSLKKGIGVKHKVVNFETLSMDSKPFKEAIEHMNKNKLVGVPNPATPYCSEYLKIRVSHSFAKTYFGTTKYIKAIGYREEDMPKRITWAELRENKKIIAPLLTDFQLPINQLKLNDFFSTQPFKLEIHSKLGNCRYCWKKSETNIIEAIQYDLSQNDTSTIEWYINQQETYQNTFFRGKKSIQELVEIAQSGKQMDLIEMIEDLEQEQDGCVCSF